MTTTCIHELEPGLKKLRLGGMVPCLKAQLEDKNLHERPYLELLGELIYAELANRAGNSLNRRLKKANIRHDQACISNIDFKSPRGLKKAQIMALSNCDWIRAHQNCLITGATGCGKTWIAGALTNAACRAGFSARFVRVPKLLKNLYAARQLAQGLDKEFQDIRKINLLVLDDWGIGQMDAIGRSDMLEIIEERNGLGSTLITSVLPVKDWASYIGDPTYADSILDRIVPNAHRIELKGDSMRGQVQYGALKNTKEG